MSSTALDLRSSRRRPVQRLAKVVLFLCAAASVLVTGGIVYSLFADTVSFFTHVGVLDFLTGAEWSPQSQSFGVLELVYGTVIIALGAMLFAAPLGVASA